MYVSFVSSPTNCLNLSQNHQTNTRKHIYDRQNHPEIGSVYKHQLSPVTTEKLQGLCLLLKPNPETAASPTDTTHTKRRCRQCERGQKWGKHGGIWARLRVNPTRPAIPSLMLSKVRSLESKLYLIQLIQHGYTTTSQTPPFSFMDFPAAERTEIHYCLVRLVGAACVCISTKNGVTMPRQWQNTVLHWWSLWLWSVDRYICHGSSQQLLFLLCTFPRVQTLRTCFVNCTGPSANNKPITPMAFSS